MPATVHTIAATTHGRYLQRVGVERAPLLIGCHGYAESSETQMERLLCVPGLETWTLVAVQGLHRFYQRHSDQVVASWMTRQDRELTIADNVAYIDAVVAAVCDPGRPIVFAGFSQGVSMAFRAACLGRHPVAAVVAYGGDIPPELTPDRLVLARRVLLGRGRDDGLYKEAAMSADTARLTAAAATVEPVLLDGGHQWGTAFSEAAGRFLAGVDR